MVSIRDLVGRGGVDRSAQQEEALGNVHLKVSDYVRNDQGMATGVIGKDLKTGKNLTISLARGDTFAKLYTNPNLEWSERQQIAASTTANRAELSEFCVKKGQRRVPQGGVIALTNVRQDFASGNLYARWASGMVHDPETEAALTGMFEVRTREGKDSQGKAFTTTYIHHIDTPRSFNASALPQERRNLALDRVFSGRLTDLPEAVPVRVGAIASVKLDDGIMAFPLPGAAEKVMDNGRSRLKPVPTLAAALSVPHKKGAEIGAVVFAALSNTPMDKLKFADTPAPERMAIFHAIYDGVKSGQHPVVVSPQAAFNPTKFQNLAFMGLRENKGQIEQANTTDRNFVSRGYFEGAAGVRFVSSKTGQVIPPVVKAIDSDEQLPHVKSEAFQKLDLAAVGELAYARAEERLKSNQPEATAEATKTAKAKPAPDDENDAHLPDPVTPGF